MRFDFGLFSVSVERKGRRRNRGGAEKVRRQSGVRRAIGRVKKRLYEKQQGRGFVCGGAFEIEGLQVHHVIPLSRCKRLAADEGNIRLVCGDCHTLIHLEGKEADYE